MYLFEVCGGLRPDRLVAEREDRAIRRGQYLISCAFVERPDPNCSVRTQHNPVSTGLNSSFQNLFRQLARCHHRTDRRDQLCSIRDQCLQCIIGPLDGPFGIHAWVEILIQYVQKNQLSPIRLSDVERQTKAFPIVTYEGDRMKDLSRSYMLNGGAGTGTDDEDGYIYTSNDLMCDRTQGSTAQVYLGHAKP